MMLGRPGYDYSKDARVWLETKNIILDVIRGVIK